MDIINLGIIFVILIAVMLLRKPLYISLGLAILAVILLYRIPIQEVGGILTGHQPLYHPPGAGILCHYLPAANAEKRDRLTMAEIAEQSFPEPTGKRDGDPFFDRVPPSMGQC